MHASQFFLYCPPPFLSYSHHILNPWHVRTHRNSCIGKPKAQGLLVTSSFIMLKTKRLSAHLLRFFLYIYIECEQSDGSCWSVVRSLMEILLTEGALIFTDEKTAEMTHHKLCLQLRRRAVIYWAISCVFTQMHYCRGCFCVSVSFVSLFLHTSAV